MSLKRRFIGQRMMSEIRRDTAVLQSRLSHVMAQAVCRDKAL
jgi:hypothetical protein